VSGFVLERGFRERDRDAVAALLREYEAALGVSLCFQDFKAEIAGLPGDYAPPRGLMLLARAAAGEDLLGCVALRAVPAEPERCEMKRMYVREAARGSGLGRALAVAVMEEARRLGYRRMGLETLPHLAAAQALYRSLGFRQTGTGGTRPRVLLFERDLAAP
jgi:ribosomal protein S18 acetylase RimI-like enzyme